MTHGKNNLKVMKYDFCIFKLKGHETWRFSNMPLEKNKELNMSNVTETKNITIDRLTGEVVVGK